jgi:hypothetical protein
VITDVGFAALRRAATLVHSVPALRARLVHAGRVVVDVAPPGTPVPEAARGVTPCGFRRAVARAWADHRAGHRFELCDLPTGAEPAVQLGVPPCGHSFPGEIHCVPSNGRYLYVFATTFPTERCRQRADHHLCDVEVPGLWGVGLRADPATETTLVYAELDADRRHRSEARTLDVLESIAADIAVRQLLDDLALTAR